MLTFIQYLIEMSQDEVTGDAENTFVTQVKSMITRRKNTNHKAADLFDMMQRRPEAFWDFLEQDAGELWEKHGYVSNVGSKEWGAFQDEFIKTFLLDPREPDPSWDID